MPTRTINEVRFTVAAADARFTIDISDSKDDGPGDNPRCAYVSVALRDGEIQTVWLQQVTRDAEGVVTGRVSTGVLTGAQLNVLRGMLTAMFNKAAQDAGYTL